MICLLYRSRIWIFWLQMNVVWWFQTDFQLLKEITWGGLYVASWLYSDICDQIMYWSHVFGYLILFLWVCFKDHSSLLCPFYAHHSSKCFIWIITSFTEKLWGLGKLNNSPRTHSQKRYWDLEYGAPGTCCYETVS